MYEKITGKSPRRRKKGAKRDWRLWASIGGVVLLALLLALPLWYSMRILYQFHVFAQDLAGSFVYGEERGTLTLCVDGAERAVDREQAGKLYGLIVDTGMGHPRDRIPAEDGIALSFGEGCTLQIWPTEIRERGRQNDTGVLIRYTRADGSVFAYDTDRLQYKSIVQIFGGGT